MSEAIDSERARSLPRPLFLALVAVGAAAWLLAARALWDTTVPSGLSLGGEDPRGSFSADYLARSSSYERFLAIDALLGAIVVVLVLWLYARRGHVLMRESAAGPIGTGMLLGMLGLGIVWLATLPFDLASLWWQRRHDVSDVPYVEHVWVSFIGLSGTFLAISFALLISMFLARLLRGWWWLAAAPFFVGLSLLLAYVSPYLIVDTVPLDERGGSPELVRDARELGRREGVPDPDVRVWELDAPPNAAAVGFGATQRVILLSALVDDDAFDRGDRREVLAHELGHLKHHHILKSVGWLALFLLPTAGLIVVATRRHGGLSRPEAVPVALLVLVVAGIVAQPLLNATTRRMEAEADWTALQATRDPDAARSLFRTLARETLSNPDPPTWSYVLNENHPTIMQRIAMAKAWEARH